MTRDRFNDIFDKIIQPGCPDFRDSEWIRRVCYDRILWEEQMDDYCAKCEAEEVNELDK